ncbi:hypothetical protein PF005_g33067, partial [Phytophthora fragariae]
GTYYSANQSVELLLFHQSALLVSCECLNRQRCQAATRHGCTGVVFTVSVSSPLFPACCHGRRARRSCARRSSLGLPRLHGRNARCWSRRCDVRRDVTVVVLAVRLLVRAVWHDGTGVMLAVGLAAEVSDMTARSLCSP